MSVRISFSATDGAALAGLVASFAQAGPTLETLMPAFDALSAKIQEVNDNLAASKADIMAKITDEKTQVSQAIADLEAKLGDILSADQLSTLTGNLDAIKAAGASTDVSDAVQGIYVPPVTEPPPAP